MSNNENPDLKELRTYNDAACKHESMQTRTRWVGGIAGRIGGQSPVIVWWCSACKKDVRNYDIFLDTDSGKSWVARTEETHVFLKSIGKSVLDPLTSVERAKWQNIQNADKDQQLKLFD